MSRSGALIRNLDGKLAYRSFRPAPLPPSPPLAFDDRAIKLLGEANAALGRLDAASRFVPDMKLFVSMYVRKEALLSSQIEGTQCTLEDVFDPGIDANADQDVADVVNYVRAVNFAIERLDTLPLCCRLLKEVHAELLRGARGQEKEPGEFRHTQNWIGAAGCTLADARYVPPNVEDMNRAMGDLERYMNEDNGYDPLVRAALIHYQFETIHPFLDGNGRMGRLIVPLYLMQQGLLSQPVLYASYFLKKNQVEYYDRLSEVRRNGNYEQWISFFLEAICTAAQDAVSSIERMEKLHEENLDRLPKTAHGKDNMRAVFGYLEKHPIISIGKTAKALGVSYNTAASCTERLVRLGVLHETTGASRNRVFAYEDYLAILRPGT